MSALPAIADEWSAELSAQLERPVRVHFGNARRNVIVAKAHGRSLELRLNRHFTTAPPDVRDALVKWLRSGRRAARACKRLDEWIDEMSKTLGAPQRRPVKIEPRGDAYNVAELAREVRAACFADELPEDIETRVTWGRRGTVPARRSIQLGSYEFERDLVRIHPVLDQPAVPRFFVRYVVFHELLHAVVDRTEVPAPTRGRGKRRVHHSPEFRRREAAYADWSAATAWQEANIKALLRSARSGKPMRGARATLSAAAKETVSGAKSLAKVAQGWLFPDSLTDD